MFLKIIILLLFTLSINFNLLSAHLRDSTNKIYVGSALNANLITENTYRNISSLEFNSLTPENCMKWENLEKTRGQPNYTLADKLVEFAEQNKMKVRGHTLVWHQQIPEWVQNLTKPELELAMKKHITDVVTHFKGKIYAWDVVNEVFNNSNEHFRDSIWYKNFGTYFIEEAFRTAHAADQNAKLYINDYNIESVNHKSDALLKLVSELKAKSVPIHGVGFQCHFASGHIPKDLSENLLRFSELGLDVAVTELDIRVALPSNEAKVADQAQKYASVYKACLSVPRCVGVTTWGFTDKHTFISKNNHDFGDALLWDINYRPKPAVAAIEAVLKGN